MSKNSIRDAVVLVTGANRGIGKAFVEEALARGAKKIYATARNAQALEQLVASGAGKVVALELDVTKASTIDGASAAASDVDIVINNAGVLGGSSFIANFDEDAARHELDVNFFGPIRVARAFAPSLARAGGGALLTVGSVASHVNFPVFGTYSASKAAAHSAIQGLRAELAAQGTTVVGIYPGPIDTDMAAGIDMPKTSTVETVRRVFDSLEQGEEDIYPDDMAREMSAGLASDAKAVERLAGQMLPEAPAAA